MSETSIGSTSAIRSTDRYYTTQSRTTSQAGRVTSTQTPVISRASRNKYTTRQGNTNAYTGSDTGDDENYRPSRALPQTQRLSAQEPNTRPNRQLRRRRQHHPLTYIGAGLIALLVLWLIGINVACWLLNTVIDPLNSSQMARQEVSQVAVGQNRFQVQAILDASNRLDLVIIPSDISKTRIVQGPIILGVPDPQHHLMLAITGQNGSRVTITATPPRQTAGLTIESPSPFTWIVDLNQK